MTDAKQQRINMVESQVRPSDVTDRRILRTMLEVPRELFVPEAMRALAYTDGAVAAGPAGGTAAPRTLLAPRTFAKLVQLAEIDPGAVVLDVGCASGYSTAVLARLAKSVVALEVDGALAALASHTLRKLGINNAVVIESPLEKGAPSHAPFNAILVNGAVAEVPHALLEQLKDGGRLVALLADGALGQAQVWRRHGKTFDARAAFDAGADPLPGFSRQAQFTL